MKATIYTKDNCTFCVQEKTLMNIRGIEWEELNMQTSPKSRDELMEKCEKINVIPRTFKENNTQQDIEDELAAFEAELEAELGQ